MNKQNISYLLILMVTLSGITYYNLNNHTAMLRNSEEKEIYKKWIQWQNDFGKSYSSEEIPLKFSAFQNNYNFIQQFNSHNNRSFTVGLNQFADLTNEEFVALKTKKTIPQRQTQENDYNEAIPKSVNWETNALQPPKDQRQCGNCMVFSLVGSLEGLYYIIHGKKLALSVQQLLDCAAPGGSGCNGEAFNPSQYYEYIEKYGIESAENYPLTLQSQQCQYNASKVIMKISGYTEVKQNSSQALLQAVAKQPVQAAIEADQSSFQFYQSGIFDDAQCGNNLDHNILVAGYNTGSENYFIIQNSWGSSWGDNGNILIAFDPKKTQDAGICGLNLDASYPNK